VFCVTGIKNNVWQICSLSTYMYIQWQFSSRDRGFTLENCVKKLYKCVVGNLGHNMGVSALTKPNVSNN